MALHHRHDNVHSQAVEPQAAEAPEWWNRWFDFGPERFGFLRTEEFLEGDTCVVRAELPGIDPDKDVEVSVESGVVTIRAHREQKTESKAKEGYRSEFRYGEFVRQIAVPEGTTSNDVQAKYADGILEVRVPCTRATSPGVVKVPVTRA